MLALQAVKHNYLIFPACENCWKNLQVEDPVDQGALDVPLEQRGEIVSVTNLIITGSTSGDLEALEEFLSCLGALF